MDCFKYFHNLRVFKVSSCVLFKVAHLEPWEKGSRKTAGQVGMCGGVSNRKTAFFLSAMVLELTLVQSSTTLCLRAFKLHSCVVLTIFQSQPCV